MKGKAELTTEFIINTVAPIFNKNGYNGTSLSDITEATGLTKGAIYGNFKNKEELAFAAFKFNVDLVVSKIRYQLAPIDSPLQQLYALVDFYKKYDLHTSAIGGCPILNIGVDANHQNSELLSMVQEVIKKLQYSIEKMIQNGQACGEIKPELNANAYAKKIFSLIEGAVFMTVTMKDESYIQEMMTHIEQIITKEMQA